MIIVDAHQDIAYSHLCFGRDYRQSALELRQLEVGTLAAEHNGLATIGLPEALAGWVALVFSTLFVAPQSNKPSPWHELQYADPAKAHALASQQFDYYERLAESSSQVMLVRTQADLDAVLATWADDAPESGRRQGLVVLMENADPIIEPNQFEEWYARGVRIVGPAWAGTRYCGGTGYPGPLTALGFELLDVMADFNAILDLSHIAEEAFYQAVDRYEGVIIASHSNPRRFRDSDRHLSDDMILRLAERDGVMGTVLFNRFLSNSWAPGDPKHDVTLNTVLDSIDYVCQLTGSAAHVGIGSDFDGGFGAQSIPDAFDTVGDLHKIGAGLRGRGYSEADIEAILSGNMLRKLRQALPLK